MQATDSLIHVNLLQTDATNSAESPWAQWAMPGASFKLLSADMASGRFTLLIRLDPNADAPPHRHVGAVEGVILDGSFHYRNDPTRTFAAGSYLFEPPGAIHQPVSPDGALMLAIFHGPVEGLDADGNITGRIDAAWHRKVWDRALLQGG